MSKITPKRVAGGAFAVVTTLVVIGIVLLVCAAISTPVDQGLVEIGGTCIAIAAVGGIATLFGLTLQTAVAQSRSREKSRQVYREALEQAKYALDRKIDSMDQHREVEETSADWTEDDDIDDDSDDDSDDIDHIDCVECRREAMRRRRHPSFRNVATETLPEVPKTVVVPDDLSTLDRSETESVDGPWELISSIPENVKVVDKDGMTYFRVGAEYFFGNGIRAAYTGLDQFGPFRRKDPE